MWECRIEMPLEVRIDRDEWIDTGVTYELILVCEPDESVGDTNYWISAVGIEGQKILELANRTREKEVATYWLARTHPLHKSAIKYALTDLKTKERLEDLWAEWLYDKPSRRADARRA
jgi:hypothetical protein